MYVNWWLIRVTLLVAFWLLPQNFGRWWRPTFDGFCSKINAVWVVGILNSYLLFKEITFYTFTFYTFGQRGHNNIGCKHEYSCQGATWWNFHYLIFIYWSYCIEHYLHFWKFHLKCTQGENGCIQSLTELRSYYNKFSRQPYKRLKCWSVNWVSRI